MSAFGGINCGIACSGLGHTPLIIPPLHRGSSFPPTTSIGRSAEKNVAPRSTSGSSHHDFAHSPRVGRSKSTSDKWLRSSSDRSHPSYSDASIYSSDDDEHQTCIINGDCENAYSLQKGLQNIGSECRNMALSAVMMSGGGGSKSSNQRHLTDIDSPWSETHSKCICDKIKSKETVIINVGGTVFETYKSTLKRLRSCKLSDDKEMIKYYRESKGDYFFDRDPFAFNIILNYLRYGDLHLPTHLCGPALMREFEFWGIDEQEIERCCFQPYNTWKTQTKSLEKLEYDRKLSTTQTDLAHDRNSKKCWRRFRAVIWTFLQDPNSSCAAKVYAWISIIFVFLSIFSFCAETHPDFQLPPEEVHDFRNLYKFFTLESKNAIPDSESKSGVNSVAIVNTTLNGTSTVSPYSNGTTPGEEALKLQHPALLIIDLICVFFFTVEFLTRLVFCPKKFRFCRSPQNIIDFVAIVPDYVEFIILAINPTGRSGLAVVEFIFILRMLRLCRIFRLIRHVPGLWILLYTLKASFNELLLMFVFLLIGMVVFASLLHFAEGDGKFNNIPVGFWWAVVTMTTVGYGDMYPTTGFGYVIGSVCAISGLLMIAFTVPIIVSNFVLYYTHVQYGISDKDTKCSKIKHHPEEMETCSLHTSYTETSETARRTKSPNDTRGNTPISGLSMDSNSNKLKEKSDIQSSKEPIARTPLEP